MLRAQRVSQIFDSMSTHEIYIFIISVFNSFCISRAEIAVENNTPVLVEHVTRSLSIMMHDRS